MIDTVLLVIVLGSFCAAFVNSAFATGGVYITLFASVSVLSVAVAIPLQSAFAAASLLSRIYFFWQHIDWRIVRVFVLGSIVGVYFGIKAFVAMPESVISILLGVVLFCLIWMPEFKRKLPLKRTFMLVGVAHSYLGAFLGVGGLLQPFILRTGLLKLQITGTLAACLFIMDIFKLSGYVSIGFNYFDYIPHIVGASIAGFIGTWCGKRVTHKVSESTFRTVFRLLVTVISFRLIYMGVTG